MTNPYVLQLIGILFAAAGLIALSAAGYIYGKPLTRDERIRRGEERRNVRSLPLNMETIGSVALILIGISILTWSKFDSCLFLNHWLPNLPDGVKFFLSCR